jgi:hypothetical protein
MSVCDDEWSYVRVCVCWLLLQMSSTLILLDDMSQS